jgi:hypothetical protein
MHSYASIMATDDKNQDQPLSQDEMIKNLIRDYPRDSLEFFKPQVLQEYGEPVEIHFHIQENKKHSHFDPNRKNDIAVIYKFKKKQELVLSLTEHWADKNKFDIYRFAHYVVDLKSQFQKADILPVALFTDKGGKWRKRPQEIIEIKCLETVYLRFQYELIRLKDYQQERYRQSKNRFIAVLRSAMQRDVQDKVMLALEMIRDYGNVESDIQKVIRNLEIIEYYLAVDKAAKQRILELLEDKEAPMIAQELQKRSEQRGLEKGLQEVEKREKQAEKRKALDTARRMKEEGLPNDLISRVTGLSVEEIEQL